MTYTTESDVEAIAVAISALISDNDLTEEERRYYLRNIATVALAALPIHKELARLKAENESAGTILIAERDRAQQAADDLTSLIEDLLGNDFGEHTNANCPWANADEALTNYLNDNKPCKQREGSEDVEARQ